MRISLYKHELEVVLALTVQLTRMRQEECTHLAIENVGPEIFGKLVDTLYSRGFYKYPGPPREEVRINFDEVSS
jgi:hypothetical protein